MPEITTTEAATQATRMVTLTDEEIHELIDILIWANQKSGGRRTQGPVDSAWTKLAEARDWPERGAHYDPAVLIRRAIARYDGKTGGAKDYRELGAVLPETAK